MSKNNNLKSIIVFDSNLRLIGMFSSYYTAAKATGVCHQMITKACNGEIIAAKGFYWREADIKEYILDCDDLGTLNLIDFDRQQGINRRIYANRHMRKNEIILESEYKKH